MKNILITPNIDRLINAARPIDIKAEDESQALKVRIRELETCYAQAVAQQNLMQNEIERLQKAYAQLVPGSH